MSEENEETKDGFGWKLLGFLWAIIAIPILFTVLYGIVAALCLVFFVLAMAFCMVVVISALAGAGLATCTVFSYIMDPMLMPTTIEELCVMGFAMIFSLTIFGILVSIPIWIVKHGYTYIRTAYREAFCNG